MRDSYFTRNAGRRPVVSDPRGIGKLAFAALVALGGCAIVDSGASAARAQSAESRAAPTMESRLTPAALQREIFAFADRYREQISQLADRAMAETSDGPTRAELQQIRVAYISAVFAMVSGPDPLDALRDLLVMVSLERAVWDDTSRDAPSNAHAARMAAALGALEADIYALAERIVPAAAIKELKTLIAEWRRAHPEQRYVAFVRFSNLGAAPRALNVEREFASEGLLAPVDAVAREVHDTRMLAERAVYLANRMPLILGWQGELVFQRIVASPEAREALDDARAYRAVMERFAREVELMPERINEQRNAFLAELFRRTAIERAALMEDAAARMRAEREASLRAFAEAADTYGPMLEQLRITAVAARDVTAGLERLRAGSGTGPAGAAADIEQVSAGLEKLATTAVELRELVGGLETLLGKGSDLRGLAAVDAMLAAQMQRLFLYAAALVILIGAVLTASLLVVRRARAA